MEVFELEFSADLPHWGYMTTATSLHPSSHPRPKTLGNFAASHFDARSLSAHQKTKSVQSSSRYRTQRTAIPGVHGYDDTVVPQSSTRFFATQFHLARTPRPAKAASSRLINLLDPEIPSSLL